MNTFITIPGKFRSFVVVVVVASGGDKVNCADHHQEKKEEFHEEETKGTRKEKGGGKLTKNFVVVFNLSNIGNRKGGVVSIYRTKTTLFLCSR